MRPFPGPCIRIIGYFAFFADWVLAALGRDAPFFLAGWFLAFVALGLSSEPVPAPTFALGLSSEPAPASAFALGFASSAFTDVFLSRSS